MRHVSRAMARPESLARGFCVLVITLIAVTACARAGQSAGDRTGVGPSRESPAVALTKRYVKEWRAEFGPAALSSNLAVRELGLTRDNKVRIARASDSLDAHLLNRAHCDPERPPEDGNYSGYFPTKMRAQADTSLRIFRHSLAAYCPYWSASTVQQGVTGVQSIERTLQSAFQLKFATARAQFVQKLDSLVARAPDDSVARGQLVRFALEAKDTARAIRAAAECSSTSAHCLSLRALVAVHRGQGPVAESIFTAARMVRRVGGQCGDSTLALLVRFTLLSPAANCVQRNALEARFWWLSTPLWSEHVNARRVEHDRRRVEFALRSEADVDELLDVTTPNDRESRALVMRYGWPNALRVLSRGAEKSHGMGVPSANDVPLRPYGAPLYSRDRFPSVPDSLAVSDPTASSPSDWLVGDPNPLHPMWGAWPNEHARMLPFVAPLADVQVAAFAGTEGGVRMAAATAWPDLAAAPSGLLLWSTHPDTIRTVAAARADADHVLRLLGPVPATPVVLSFEVRAGRRDSTTRAWRWRSGHHLAPDLRTAVATGHGLSDIMLVEGTEGLFQRPATLEAMASAMLPSTTIARTRSRVGVFWEVYGVIPTDTVHYELTLTSTRPVPLLARVFAGLMGRTTERADAVEIRWDRALTGTMLQRDSATRATLPDGLVLVLPSLPSGDYQLELRTSTTSSAQAYRAVRSFAVQ